MRVQFAAKIRSEAEGRAACEKLRDERKPEPDHAERQYERAAFKYAGRIAGVCLRNRRVDYPRHDDRHEKFEYRFDELEKRTENGFQSVAFEKSYEF